MDIEKLFEQAIEHPIIGISILVIIVAIIVVWIYYDKTKLAPKRRRIAEEARRKQIEYLRNNPLSNYSICKSCGWIGRLASSGYGSSTGGELATLGGVATATAGAGSSVAGIALIIIGIPLLFVCGIGVIPIIIGAMMLIAGGTAATAGTVATGAGTAASQRAKLAQQQRKPACPVCKNTGIIPVYSSVAKQIMTNNQEISIKAEKIANSVIASLPTSKPPPLPKNTKKLHQKQSISQKKHNFKFNCPNCQQPLEAEEELLGQEIDCPACDKAMKLPKQL